MKDITLINELAGDVYDRVVDSIVHDDDHYVGFWTDDEEYLDLVVLTSQAMAIANESNQFVYVWDDGTGVVSLYVAPSLEDLMNHEEQ